ncbi:hypothetical protein MTR67_035821 [Solanum verrucosum]|uniref:Uncharacterized protein n=1 Tax=Solanum verrucosum TaxID=315347 RepID=A0AAF0ZKA2_SOLVR|nr:hypothetical protein MTR67_035821 [Solanum verrucosum]
MLKKCMGNPSLIIPTEDIGINDSLSYEEIPVQILDRQVRLGEKRKEEEKEQEKQDSSRSSSLTCGFCRGCVFEWNLMYIESINDSKCLGNEPLKFRGFRVEKRARKVVKRLGKRVGRRASQRAPKGSLRFTPWGDAPASAPQGSL